MSKPPTGDTITDKQLREVRGFDLLCAICKNWDLYCICERPVVCRCPHHGCDAMVARCAEIINARNASKSGETLGQVEITDNDIRVFRTESRAVGDMERVRACSAALGLGVGDGALGLLDADVCRARVEEIIRREHTPGTSAARDASKDGAK